ncbi:hypothetical protein GQ53DRAFT_774041 [Thozetella sp. PMI_491]|nr:hypothetical protein GQ53DRAFT_774041 [Thozetella sp. PMI_491]
MHASAVFTTILALAANVAIAAPAPTVPEADVPTPVGELLPKRTTHSGIATVYQQFGGAGSCGNYNSDSSIIVALSNYWMKDEYQSAYCGRLIQIKDTDNGKTITAKVQDTCPGCDENHVDLSIGAWNKLTNSAAWGVANVEWHFCNVNGQC